MKTKWLTETIHYDGSQLRSQYAYFQHGLLGDSIVAWQGPCAVAPEFMVDGEDFLQKQTIAGASMLHFIVEKFSMPLAIAVALQRLMTARMLETLRDTATSADRAFLRREGDDIFLRDRKLSISIATVSPVSMLIHFALNVVNEGTPVPTVSLNDLGVDPQKLAEQFMTWLREEDVSIREATQKVRWVR